MNDIAASAPSAIAEFSATEAGLAELASRLAGIIHDCTTTKGMEAARRDRRECVTLRTTLEEIRVREKAPLLTRERLLDGEAKRITAAIQALERPIDEQIQKEEKRKADVRAVADKAEADRIASIRRRIDWIRGRVVELAGKPSADIDAELTALLTLPITAELYAEFASEAHDVKGATIEKLSAMVAAERANEWEAAKLYTERQAFETQQREANEQRQREDKERADRIAKQDEGRAFEQAWDDAHRENLQRSEDAKLAAERAAQRKRDDDARAQKLRERTELEMAAEPWLAIYLAIKIGEDKTIVDLDARRGMLRALIEVRGANERLAVLDAQP